MSAWDDVDAWAAGQRANTPPRRPRQEGESRDRSRTAKAAARIAAGFHPFGMKLREPAGETCGTCKHLITKKLGHTYFKCGQYPDTGGPATDVRKKWAACRGWVPKETP